jgi:hypothetical protein
MRHRPHLRALQPLLAGRMAVTSPLTKGYRVTDASAPRRVAVPVVVEIESATESNAQGQLVNVTATTATAGGISPCLDQA